MPNRLRNLFTKFVGGSGNSSLQSFVSLLNTGSMTRSQYQLLLEYRGLVYKCVDTLAKAIGRKYEPLAYKVDGKKNNALTTHPFLNVLSNPNPTQNKADLFAATVAYLKLTGDAFWYLVRGDVTGQPKQIYTLRPDRVKIAVDDKTGDVTGYTLKRDNDTDIPLDVLDVVHFKTFNPVNNYRGLGVVQAGLLQIETEYATALFQHNFMKNQATPSGILTLKGRDDGKISNEAFIKIKRQWAEQQSGLDNAGKTLIIREADADFQKIGLSLSDLELVSLKKATKEDVRELFGVPQQILGTTENTGAGGLGRANIEATEYIFAKYTVEPDMDTFDDTLTMVIRKYYPKDRDIVIKHESTVPADKEMILKETQAGADVWLTRNEIRQRQGLSPIKGGDKLYLQTSQLPMTDTVASKAMGSIRLKAKTGKFVVAKDAKEQAYFAALDKTERSVTRVVMGNVRDMLEEQQARIVSRLKPKKSKQKAFEEITYDIDLGIDKVILTVVGSLISAMQSAGEEGLSFTGNPDMEFLITQATRDAVFNSTQRQLQTFNLETAEKIQKQLAAGLAEGESIDQLTARVESIFTEAKGYRAERIAQTESHKAVNQGVTMVYKQLGIKQMQWVTQGESCGFCEAMNGSIVNVGEAFIPLGAAVTSADGEKYTANYDDVKYADLHPNCDCKLVPILNQ